MKVLVVKRDKLGDLLLTTPMLARLKAARPGVETHVLANDYNAWVLEGNPHVDHMWVYRRVRSGGRVSLGAAWAWLALRRALRQERYDWVIVANGDESARGIRRGLAVRGARTVAVCADPARHAGLTDPVAPDAATHEVDRLLQLLAPLGVPAGDAPLPSYVLPASAAAFAARWLDERGLRTGGYVVLGLGARRAKKQPVAEQVLRWSAWWKSRHGLDTVFTWTPGRADDPAYPGDDDLARPVVAAASRGQAPQIHAHRGTVLERIGLIWSARASLFPDSGLMHFAAASPGGVLGFFAETAVSPGPERWAPRGRRAEWLVAAKSVSELPDALVYERLERLLSP